MVYWYSMQMTEPFAAIITLKRNTFHGPASETILQSNYLSVIFRSKVISTFYLCHISIGAEEGVQVLFTTFPRIEYVAGDLLRHAIDLTLLESR